MQSTSWIYLGKRLVSLWRMSIRKLLPLKFIPPTSSITTSFLRKQHNLKFFLTSCNIIFKIILKFFYLKNWGKKQYGGGPRAAIQFKLLPILTVTCFCSFCFYYGFLLHVLIMDLNICPVGGVKVETSRGGMISVDVIFLVLARL